MKLALSVLKRLRPRKGEILYIIVDMSHIPKRVKRMAGLGYFKDPATRHYIYGHQFLALGFWFRGLFLPAMMWM